MSERLVVGLVGHAGTGKSTLAHYMQQEHGFFVFESSEYIKQAADNTGIELSTREDYINFFCDEQERIGKNWLSEAMLSTEEERVAHCGARSKYDFLRIQEAGGLMIALVCPPEICVERLDKANPKNAQSLDEYLASMQIENSTNEYGPHLDWCIEHADIQLDTSVPKTEMIEVFEDIYKRFITSS